MTGDLIGFIAGVVMIVVGGLVCSLAGYALWTLAGWLTAPIRRRYRRRRQPPLHELEARYEREVRLVLYPVRDVWAATATPPIDLNHNGDAAQ